VLKRPVTVTTKNTPLSLKFHLDLICNSSDRLRFLVKQYSRYGSLVRYALRTMVDHQTTVAYLGRMVKTSEVEAGNAVACAVAVH
jgi:hypothetical protein